VVVAVLDGEIEDTAAGKIVERSMAAVVGRVVVVVAEEGVGDDVS
jgi:hypothetical protein